MIIYGWATKLIKSGELPNKQCQTCGTNMSIDVSASYFSLFWIPIFPYSKKIRVACPRCDYAIKPKDAGEEIQAMAAQLKRAAKTPWYMFSGLLLILLAIGYFISDSYFANQKYETYLNEPEINDVYTLYDDEEETEYKYYLWKVIGIEGDSIMVSPASFQYNYQPSKLEDADGFYDFYYTYHKGELLDLLEDDVLWSVKRGYDPSSGFDREIEFVPDSTGIN